jgi:hypothetical protein
VHWNVAPLYPGMRDAGLFVVSVPKSGRTWLRVFLTAYHAFERGLEPGRHLAATERELGILFAHDRWEHAAAPWPTLALGRCLIPAERRRAAKIVLLIRDPRDAVVSLYFQLSRRQGWFSGTLEEMLRHPVFGLRYLIDVMNGWAREWHGSARLSRVRYEDLAARPEPGFRAFVRFAFGAANEAALEKAVAFSSFERMKALEVDGYFHDASLRGMRPDDPDSFKVRRGKVGDFRDALSAGSVAFADRELGRLDPWFGYPV